MRRNVALSLLGLAGILAACGGSGGGPAPGSIRVTANLTAPATWAPISGLDCDYVVAANKEIEVQAALTIQPGTKVCFEANSGLEVMQTGSLNAKGVMGNRITFTGTVAAKGHWKGLAFRSNNPANELDFVDVLFAGSNDNFCCDYFEGPNISAAVLVGSNAAATATLKLTNSQISSSGNYGLYVFNSDRLESFSANTFSANNKAPVAIPITEMGKMDLASNFSGAGLTANTVNAVQVNESSPASTNVAQTVRKLDVPYAMMLGDPGSQQKYQGALTLQAGVRLEFESNTGLEITETGSLNAVGTSTDPIIFTGRVASKGYWKGIAFRSNNPANRLERAEVSYAGNNDYFCCDYFEGPNISAAVLVGSNAVKNATLALVNSTVRESDNYGVYQFDGGNAITASGNAYSNNDLGNKPVGLP